MPRRSAGGDCLPPQHTAFDRGRQGQGTTSLITLAFEGVESVSLDAHGNLLLHTSYGDLAQAQHSRLRSATALNARAVAGGCGSSRSWRQAQ